MFNPTFEVQNMESEAFQNALFGSASFPNEALGYSCLWAMCLIVRYFLRVEEKVEKLESLKKIIAEKNNKINKSPKKKIFKKRKYKKKFDMKKN